MDAVDTALTKLESNDWRERWEAVKELRQYQDPRAFSGIVSALYDPEREELTAEAVEALMELGTTEAADALLAAIRSDNIEVAEYVAMWLEWSHSPWADAILARDKELGQ